MVARISRFFSDPNNPFRDKRVRQAVSLAIDRKAINDAESGGMGKVSGNWINNDVESALEWPEWEYNIAKAKELMKEAGHPNGFKVDWLTVVPNFFSRGERVISQLKAIGIDTRLQTMERGVYLKKLSTGLKEWPGVQIIMNATRIGGSWANWYEGMFKCGGFQGQDMICVKDLDGNSNSIRNRSIATSARSWPRKFSADPGELLLRADIPARFRQRDRTADQGRKVAGCLPDDHERLRLSVGGHRVEGSRRHAELKADGWLGAAAMTQFIIRRTAYALITLFILSLTIFMIVRLTGDPVSLLAEPGARAEDLDRLRAEWGLDRSWPVQYIAFVKNIITGDLGKSFNYQMPVSTLYFQRLPASLQLALAASRSRSSSAFRRGSYPP